MELPKVGKIVIYSEKNVERKTDNSLDRGKN